MTDPNELIAAIVAYVREHPPEPLTLHISPKMVEFLEQENRKRLWAGVNFPLKESVWRWYDAEAWEDCCVVAYLASGLSKSMKRNPK